MYPSLQTIERLSHTSYKINVYVLVHAIHSAHTSNIVITVSNNTYIFY